MWSRIRSGFRSERGSAIVVAVLASIMVLMTAGAAVDLGLYYLKLQRVRNVASTSIDMAQKVRSMFLLDASYGLVVERQIKQYAQGNGLNPNKLYVKVKSQYMDIVGTEGKNVTFYFTFEYQDSYDCIFLPLIGINQLPVKVRKGESLTYSNVPVWDPGDPFEEWQPVKEQFSKYDTTVNYPNDKNSDSNPFHIQATTDYERIEYDEYIWQPNKQGGICYRVEMYDATLCTAED